MILSYLISQFRRRQVRKDMMILLSLLEAYLENGKIIQFLYPHFLL